MGSNMFSEQTLQGITSEDVSWLRVQLRKGDAKLESAA